MEISNKLTIRHCLNQNAEIGRLIRSRLAKDQQEGVSLLSEASKLQELFIWNNLPLIKNWA